MGTLQMYFAYATVNVIHIDDLSTQSMSESIKHSIPPISALERHFTKYLTVHQPINEQRAIPEGIAMETTVA
jgi:hypothetical protein